MEPVNHLNLITKDLANRRIKGLGHIQDHHLDTIQFGLRAALESRHHVLNPSPLKRRDRSTFIQVHEDRIVVMPLAPGVFINPEGATQLAGASATALFKGPTKHCASGQAIATGEFLAGATVKKFLTDLIVKPLGPLHPITERLTFLPRPMVAI